MQASPSLPRQSTRYLSVVALACGATAVLATEAGAQEYCVACTGPEAVYRCVVEQAVPQGIPLKMLCLGTLSRDGGHATCAVRGGTVFDCNGPIRRIDAKAANQAATQPAPPPPAADKAAVPPVPGAAGVQPPPGQAAQKAKSPADSEPPKTVEELAKRVTKSSGESLDKAGSAIANSTSKAWGCLTSLFKTC